MPNSLQVPNKHNNENENSFISSPSMSKVSEHDSSEDDQIFDNNVQYINQNGVNKKSQGMIEQPPIRYRSSADNAEVKTYHPESNYAGYKVYFAIFIFIF